MQICYDSYLKDKAEVVYIFLEMKGIIIISFGIS